MDVDEYCQRLCYYYPQYFRFRWNLLRVEKVILSHSTTHRDLEVLEGLVCDWEVVLSQDKWRTKGAAAWNSDEDELSSDGKFRLSRE
jgi:hypothetical protein